MTARILIAAHSGVRGGAECCLDTTLRHLDRSRFDARVVFGSDGPMVESARAMGLAVEVWPLAWWMGYEPSAWHYKNATAGSLLRVARLARLLKRHAIDLVYTNTAVIFEAALAARLARVAHVWHVHEVLAPRHLRPRMLPLGLIARLIGRLSQRVIFESDAAMDVCRGLVPDHKMRRVYNSVRFEGLVGWDKRSAGPPSHGGNRGAQEAVGSGQWAVGGGSALAPDPSPADRRGEKMCQVVWIGRLSERKNPLMLLHAIRHMRHAADCRFQIVGEGPLEKEVRSAIGAMGLGDRCRLVPFQDDVRPVLQGADVLTLTSREESFGLVLAEAAAFEVPSVATRTQGPAEVVLDGRTGLLVEPDDVPGLAAALDRLAADPGLRRSLGRAAAQRAEECFCPKINTRKIEGILDEVVQPGDLSAAASGSMTSGPENTAGKPAG